MSIWLQWLLVVICATAILITLLPLIARAQKRTRQRAQKQYESWHCPKCGVAFGPQQQHAGWVCRTLYIRQGFLRLFGFREITTAGPVLLCTVCQQSFEMEADGRARRNNQKHDDTTSETRAI